MVVGQAIEWVFAACVDLEEAASRFYKASLLGPVRVYSEDETQRTIKARRKDSVVQKIWDHNVAKTQLAGLMTECSGQIRRRWNGIDDRTTFSGDCRLDTPDLRPRAAQMTFKSGLRAQARR